MSTPQSPKQLPEHAATTILNALVCALDTYVRHAETARNVARSERLAAQFDAQAAACTVLLKEIAEGDALYVDQLGGEG